MDGGTTTPATTAARARVDGIELDYATAGPEDGPCLLLVNGLGEPRVAWPDALLSALADRGLRLVAFDTRDAGRSTRLEEAGKVDQGTLLDALSGGAVDPPYTLGTMAADAVGLLDHLGIGRAHVLGRSMGAMIAQHLGFSHPGRVASLVLVGSTTGRRDVGQPTDEAWRTMMATPPRDREGFVEHWLEQARVVGGPLLDERRVRARAAAIHDHGYYPEGVGRQFLAVLADGDRTGRLAGVGAPTLVLHGRADPLVDVSGGRATAAAVPGAELVVLEEVGHLLPDALAEDVAGLVGRHVRDAPGRGHAGHATNGRTP